MATPAPHLTLPAGSVRRLVESATSPVPESSPFRTLLRTAATGGGMVAAAPDPPELESFRDALDVLARPEAYVKVLIFTPDKEDEDILGFLVRAGKAVSFTLQEGALQVARAQPLGALVETLAGSLTREGPLRGGEVWLWPSVVQVLTGLWQATPDPALPLTRSSVLERLTTPEFPEVQARSFIDAVIASGALRADGEQLVVEQGLRPWLAALWSGHAVQVGYVPLASDVPLERAIDAKGEHLLFMGPPDQRVLNRVVTGEELREHLGGRASREESMLHLSAPAPEDVTAMLRTLLRADPGPARG